MTLSKYSIASYNSQMSTTEPISLPRMRSLAFLDDCYYLLFQPYNSKDTNLSPEARTQKKPEARFHFCERQLVPAPTAHWSSKPCFGPVSWAWQQPSSCWAGR